MKKITIIVIEQHIEYNDTAKYTNIHEPKVIKTKTINVMPNQKVRINLEFKN